MDSACTTGAVARLLGTSAPRVIRAADRLFPGPRRPGAHRQFTRAQVLRLASELGRVPPSPRSREELFTLAALSLRPFGLRSARAVAAAAGISPTAASKALAELESEGIVRRSHTWVVEGKPRRVDPWVVDFTSEAWWAVEPAVSRVLLPASKRVRHRADAVPRLLWHHFWNTDPQQLSIERDGQYVAGRLIGSEDPEAIAWVAGTISSRDLRAASRLRSLTPSQRWLAKNLAAAR